MLAAVHPKMGTVSALNSSGLTPADAIDAADLALWHVEIPSRTVTASPRFRSLFGMPDDAFDLDVWLARIAPEDRERVAGMLAASLDYAAEFDGEFRIVCPDENPRWISARGRVLDPSRFVGVAQDITARRMADELARNRQKLESMGLLAGGIAHDFNNLLTGILGHSSLVLEDEQLSEENRECVRSVMLAAETAAQLTRQMLAYSGRGRLVVEPVALSRRVKELLPLLQATVPNNVALVLELCDDLPPVEADSAQLRQLILNLVMNAAEACSAEGGSVTLSTRLAHLRDRHVPDVEGRELGSGDYVVLEVRDNGHGMDPATQARVFDPFFTTKFAGRGLGLAAVLGIVRGHKGAIQLQSQPLAGTVFRVFFPPSEVDDHRPAAPAAAQSGKGLVLVVDDEDTIRRTARMALERHGFTVLLARNGLEGVEFFRQQSDRIAVVLLDMAMPVMNGEEAFRQIVQIRPGIPVVASSGYDETATRRRFGEGVAGFLQKPYTAAQLVNQMKRVMRTE